MPKTKKSLRGEASISPRAFRRRRNVQAPTHGGTGALTAKPSPRCEPLTGPLLQKPAGISQDPELGEAKSLQGQTQQALLTKVCNLVTDAGQVSFQHFERDGVLEGAHARPLVGLEER